jgi:hypothetical protein
MVCAPPGIYSVKKSWKLSDLKEYQTAPPYANVVNKRSPNIFLARKSRRLGFDGGGGRGGGWIVGRGGAAVGDTVDVWTLGAIGGTAGFCDEGPFDNGVLVGPSALTADVLEKLLYLLELGFKFDYRCWWCVQARRARPKEGDSPLYCSSEHRPDFLKNSQR